MRATLWAAGLWLLAAPAEAGVYNLGETPPFVPFAEARGYVLRLRSAAVPGSGTPDATSYRGRIARQAADLERLRGGGPFATLDRVSLSACYLRLGRVAEARDLLLAGDAGHFLVLSNLASAYFLTGELEMACRTQERVLAAWPNVWVGWTEAQRQFFRDCERRLLRLYEGRREEARRRRSTDLGVDDLFDPRFRFVGPGNRYAAGALAQPMRDRLPDNASAVIFQLCCWYPADSRLYWQLGEALNAQGAVESAYDILNELADAGRAGLFQDLAEHRRVLREALPAYRVLKSPTHQGELLALLLAIPRPMPGTGGVGEAAYTVASGAAVKVMEQISQPNLPDNVGTPDQTEAPLPFNWKHLLGGFATGFLVAALLGFQMQEWRRRRKEAPEAG